MRRAEARSLPIAFGPGGFFARAFPGYEMRFGQVAMAREVERAIVDRAHLLVEAPCGVGKGMSYLVPAIEHAVKGGKKVVVVTANIGLQEQLVKTDLPMLREVLPTPFSFAIAKGRANYLCLAQFEATQREVSMKGAAKLLGAGSMRWRELEGWAMTTRRGDVSELSFEPGGLRPRFTVSAEECVGPHCPRRRECHAEAAKDAFWRADVIVTNYAMFLLDIVLREASEDQSGTLPAWDVAILDEAHRCPDLAREFFGFRVTEGAIKHAARLLDRDDDAIDPALAADLRGEASSYFDELLRHRRSKEYRVRLRRPGEGPDPSALIAMLQAGAGALSRAMAIEDEPALRQKLRQGMTRCSVMAAQLLAAHALSEPEAKVYCVELDGPEGRERAALASKLVRPADALRPKLFAKGGRSIVMCSATLAVGGSFAFAREELGCDGARELAVGSPFDHRRQAMLLVPRGLPPSTDRIEHERAVARLMVRIAHASRGRMLGLFTSNRGLRAAAAAFEEVPHADRTWREVLVQGDAPRSELVARLKAQVGGVLLGVDSFWEGVDVPGEALSVVVIDRLPFATPDDPILDAVDALTPGGAFASWSLPRAVTELRQGVGRLIRRATDRGIVVVLDDRLVSKGYGRKFLRSLPDMPLTRDFEEALAFLGPASESRLLEGNVSA